jgi:hypothetical protein
MKKNIIKITLFLVATNCCFGANPPTLCEPDISTEPWKQVSKYNVDFSRIADAVNMAIKVLPSAPKPEIKGSIEFKSFNKKGCCTPDDAAPKELRKASIGGKVRAGVNAGLLPIPGLSIPGVAGGVVTATAAVFVSGEGAAQQQCGGTGELKLCAEIKAGGEVSLGGGLSVFGNWISGIVEGRATVSGGFKWCENEDPDWSTVCIRGQINAVLSSPFGSESFTIAEVSDCL